MAYQKYLTEAIVLRGTDRGEADRLFSLLTHDFGLVYARASAVRRESSKMRYALQNFAHANVSLVRGNRGWRVAGATALDHLDVANTSGTSAFARIAQLVGRLVAGEERNEYLFQTVADARAAFMREPADRHASIELLCVARILHSLGYLSSEAFSGALLSHTTFASSDIEEISARRETLLSSVNRAIAETQM